MANKKNSILFELSKDGQQIGHILGTMHVRDDKAFTYLHPLQELISQSSIYLGETDIDKLSTLQIDDPSSAKQMNLDQLYSEKKYNKMRKICLKAFDIDLDSVKQMSPFGVISLLTYSVLSKDQPLVLDQALWAYARQVNIPVEGLESVEEQKSIYDAIPMKWQVKELKELLRNVKKFRKSVLKITNDYQKMNVNKLYQSSKKQLGGMKNLLLYDRNEIMAKRIELYSQSYNNLFAAVGIGHLPGKKGVLRLLKKKNILSKPVTFSK